MLRCIKHGLLLFILLGFSGITNAQEFGDFLRQLRALTDPGEKYLKIDSLIQAQDALPYVVGDSAHFLFRGVASTVALTGDFNGWAAAEDMLMREVQTDFWHVSKQFELDARLDYKFVLDASNWILDPLNPNTVPGGFGPNSELAMPAYVQPWEIEPRPDIQKGNINRHTVPSSETQTSYTVDIYTPHNYDENREEGYPVAYFQDGGDYLNLASAKHVVDNLVDSNLIAEIIAVFVHPDNRNEEYAFSKREEYRQFFVQELVPFVDTLLNTRSEPDGRAVIGPSFGGNISTLIAYQHPDVFGHCGLHSPAFWPNSFEAFQMIQDGPAVDVSIATNWGSYEELATTMPLFVNVLDNKGYKFIAEEKHEGHSWGLWRATIDDFLIFFFPPDTTISVPFTPGEFEIDLYPIPGNDHLVLSSPVVIEEAWVCDTSGKRMPIRLTQIGETYQINIQHLSSGQYFLLLKSESGMVSKSFSKVQ